MLLGWGRGPRLCPSLTDVEGPVELQPDVALGRGQPHHPGQLVHSQPRQLHVDLGLHLVPLVIAEGDGGSHRQVLVPIPNVVREHHISGGWGSRGDQLSGAPGPPKSCPKPLQSQPWPLLVTLQRLCRFPSIPTRSPCNPSFATHLITL